MAKEQLTEQNKEIMRQLIWNFKNTNLSVANINKDIVQLIAEMIAQALQMSQETEKMN